MQFRNQRALQTKQAVMYQFSYRTEIWAIKHNKKVRAALYLKIAT